MWGCWGCRHHGAQKEFDKSGCNLVLIIERITDNIDGESKETNGGNDEFLQAFTRLVQQWEYETPTCLELRRSLAELIAVDIQKQETERQPVPVGGGQAVLAREEGEGMTVWQTSRQKDMAKTRPLELKEKDLRPFDLSKRNMIAWQLLESMLEKEFLCASLRLWH